MCTTQEAKQISREMANEFYAKFLEDFHKIADSIIKANEHVMSPETKKNFDDVEKRLARNDEDHVTISAKVDSIMQSQKEHSEKLDKFLPLLEEIRKNTEARGVIRKFIKNWGGIMVSTSLAVWAIFKLWHSGQK